MEFEELVRDQHHLGNQIETLARNFSKDPKDRKTPAYFSKRLEALTELADEFHNNHEAIMATKTKPLDDDYLVKDYYSKITQIIVKHTKLFEQGSVQPLRLDDEPRPSNEPQRDVSNQPPASSEIRKILRNQRALMKALIRNVDEIFTDRHQEHHPSYYNIKATIIEKYMVDLANNNAILWSSTDNDQIEDYNIETYYELEEKAEAAMIELQQHMQENPQGPPQRAQAPGDIDVILPKIKLPIFDGNYQRWVEFKDIFSELVHNTTISDARKMHYLTTSLQGEPKNLIKHLPAVGINYATAWSLISSRYDNKRLLVSTLLNKLMSQSYSKRESSSALKSLHDITKECIQGLKAQGIPVQHWDVILVHIVLHKMDEETQIAFEHSLTDNRRLIAIDELLSFLERRFQSLETRGKGDRATTRTCASVTASELREKCKICKAEAHQIYACRKFINAELSQRWKWVKDLQLCVNCLKPGHRVNECNSRHCKKCTKTHNTLLHNPKVNSSSNNITSQEKSLAKPPSVSTAEVPHDQTATRVSLLTNHTNKDPHYVLLGTACIQIISNNGEPIECRAILDSGSQVNLITDRLWKRLGGRSRQLRLSVEGIGVHKSKLHHQASIQFQSNINNYVAKVDVHIIPKIVSDQPVHHFDVENWGIPQNIHLADPEFNKPAGIDCLLGADIIFELLIGGQIKLGNNLPILQNTVLGWVIAGKVNSSITNNLVCGICTAKELEAAVSQFWDLGETSDNQTELTGDEVLCESHFVQSTTRTEDGRFVVKLPLNNHPTILAESKGIAYKRFNSIERRLHANPTLRDQYVAFMREYETLGHMTKIDSEKISRPYYFIPHHCVIRPESSSTKLRVVFDASAHNSSGASLNDIMHTGPTVQSELFAILLRFRMHKYVLKTDIEKMYRQIWVHQEDRNLQLILWRDNENQPISVYQLNTVTYGTRAAPYLATRCLIKLADDYQGQYPYGATSLRRDFYVDDGLIGTDSVHEALMIQKQLIAMLGGAGMKLKKWCSNHKALLNEIAAEDQEVNLSFDSKETQATKTLGLLWLPKSDVFCIKANIQEHKHATKRTMSSDLAHIFDPLGLIGPVLVTGKIQLQKTWQTKLDWDENLPTEIERKWVAYKNDLVALDNIRFPRYIFSNQDTNTEIHAFADASERAYGAAVYIRTVQKDKTIKVHLLCSKSRVAPVKSQTIPRLELCAALLAAELVSRVKADMGMGNKRAFCWTDSQIVLSWLHNQPGRLPVYVAHRILKILRLTTQEQWHHVPSKQNPADILSRGIKPCELSSCTMWLYGPLFLYQPKPLWPQPIKQESTNDNNTATALTIQQSINESGLAYKIQSRNSFAHVQRVTGYILRFIRHTRRPKESRTKHIELSPLELDAALKLIVRQIQESDFDDLKRTLRKENFVPKTSPYSSLTPFLDEEGIIRVGGRLSSAEQQFDATHQMMLPSQDPLVKLLVDKIHQEHYHCGPQALLAQVRQRFWPIKGKSLTRAVVQRCVQCTRARPTMYTQIMGNLPKHRVQPARPFLNSGVDYCGPFFVHFKTRGKRPQKAYLAVFCCFATKAVHLELVTELTTDAFIGALKRFIARRGHCKTLYCDNATNFVGARNKLLELNDIIYAHPAQESIIEACSKKGIDFQFIPPRSPHFGGLWEAAVKSAKHLLIKNVSTASLTYEELETVMTEIEAILNSRPLIPNSADANDLNALTPGHFLIGEPLTSSVDIHSKISKDSLQNRWQLVSQLKHNFWDRWCKEYLNELQQRHRWKGPISEIKPNTMVIMKDDNVPVLQWPLGRIIKIYKGDDGLVRVCDVRTQRGVFKRPIHKLAPLFPENKQEQEIQSENTPNSSSPPRNISTSRINPPRPSTCDEAPPKRVRLNPTLVFTILTIFFLPMVMGNPINITKFENKPGMYFEQINLVKLMSVNWKMLVYFDLEPYQDQLNILIEGTQKLQNLCDSSKGNLACKMLLDYFDHMRAELQADFNMFTVKRKKRGAIDVVGNIAHSLFGVLDSNYETQMSMTIKKLKRNDEYLEGLLKNQTSLIDSTINIIKKSQLDVQDKFKETDNMIQNVRIEERILMLSVQMLTVTNNMQRIHSAIMDVLVDSQHNKINPLLLTPQQISEEINKIRAHLPAHLQLPIHQTNLLEVYKLIKVDGVIAQDHIIFSIDLPLTNPREFQLMHITPIIATINKTLIAVKTSTKFIAISLHHDEFLPMSQHEVDACWRLGNDDLICPNVPAIYQVTRHPLIHKCELDLIKDLPNPRCDFNQLEDTTLWQQLYHSNQYMFSTTDTIKLNAVCGNTIIQITLESTGLITLRPDCVIKNDLITIQGRQQIITTVQASPTRFTPISGWTKQYAGTNFSTKQFKPTIQELEAMQQELSEMLKTTLPADEINPGTHGMIVGYVAIALTLLIVMIIVVYKYKRPKNSFNPTLTSQPTTTEC